MTWPNLKAMLRRERRLVDRHVVELVGAQPVITSTELLARATKCGCARCHCIAAHLRDHHGVTVPPAARAN